MDVVLVRWPLEQQRRAVLAREGRLRLLVIEGDAAAPDDVDCLEDWIRVPAPACDLRARVEGLVLRAQGDRPAGPPTLGPDGVLRHAGSWVPLPPVEARLLGALLARQGAVVSRERLDRSGWPEGSPGRNALDIHVSRMRRRISPLGLTLETVRSRGYLLRATGPGPSRPGVGS